MFESQGLPPYPPRHNAWQYPPPPVGRRWLWVAIAATVVSAVTAIGLLAVAIAIGTDDYRGVIQDSRLTAVIADECDIMTSTVESMPVTGSPREQAAVLADQDQAVTTMVDRVRTEAGGAVRDDRPAEAWLRDWERLVAARKAYAGGVLVGADPDLEIPRDGDGNAIYVRMDDVWIGDVVCEVPEALLNPYPGTQSAV